VTDDVWKEIQSRNISPEDSRSLHTFHIDRNSWIRRNICVRDI